MTRWRKTDRDTAQSQASFALHSWVSVKLRPNRGDGRVRPRGGLTEEQERFVATASTYELSLAGMAFPVPLHLLFNALAAWPGHLAARFRPADSLRTE